MTAQGQAESFDDAQWVNSLSSGALLELLTKVGYEIVSIRAFDATQILITIKAAFEDLNHVAVIAWL